ncbi:hypothetical protein HYQ46_008944 [Verticillium longisporum]|nr:hypothetical protein HYQ46_008944 [Verticillium longisporum]
MHIPFFQATLHSPGWPLRRQPEMTPYTHNVVRVGRNGEVQYGMSKVAWCLIESDVDQKVQVTSKAGQARGLRGLAQHELEL